jgi:hypothetical protein
MRQGWPRPESDVWFGLLLVGAVTGPFGLFLLAMGRWMGDVEPIATAYVLGGLGMVLFAVAHGVAFHRVSPRLAAGGLLTMGAGMALVAAAAFTGRLALADAGFAVMALAVGALATAQWFDHRRTWGLAGLGIVAATLGLTAYALGVVFGVWTVTGGFASSWPGGAALWQWVFEPVRLALVLTMVWLIINAGWLWMELTREHGAPRALAVDPE